MEATVIHLVEVASEKVSRNAISEALRLVLKLLRNIQHHPGEDKYRAIKKSNPTIRKKLLLDEGEEIEHVVTTLLCQAGFDVTAEQIVFEDPEVPEELLHLLELLASEIVEQDEVPEQRPASTTSPSEVIKPLSSREKTFKKKENAEFEKRTDDLKQLRAEQAERYQNASSYASYLPSFGGSDDGSSSSSSRNKGFLSKLFGKQGRGKKSANTLRNRGNKVMTISDLPQTQQPRG